MPTDNIPDFHFMAGHKMPFSEIVRAWLAFKDLHRRNLIHVDLLAEQLARARNAGWEIGFWGNRPNRDYLERMATNPLDFFQGHEWGADFYVGKWDVGASQNLAYEFYDLAVKSREDAGLPATFFTEADIQHGVSLFRTGLVEELRRRQESKRWESVKPEARTYQTSPFFLPNPLQSLFWEYGIDGEGKVYTRKSLGGLFTFSELPSLMVQRIVDPHIEGGRLWGDVVFKSDSGVEVRWKNVLLPGKTLTRAMRVIDAHRKGVSVPDTAERVERSCPHCAETILVKARLCKHCHQPVEPASNSTL